ncbi:LYR motif-containing protein 4 [Labeo rohita]|uniref:LYR motif-containing protein 4 n=1 Tax=Labeo rohita TaxID=84645 RepID=A0ABQ8MXG5_LABRO|nr:LYR motif-containing protein 4 [Labeo rohita]
MQHEKNYCEINNGVVQQGSSDRTLQDAYERETYALRRVKDGFRENLHVDNPKTLDMLINQARENLVLIKRQASNASFVSYSISKTISLIFVSQVSIGHLYSAQRTVVEKEPHL